MENDKKKGNPNSLEYQATKQLIRQKIKSVLMRIPETTREKKSAIIAETLCSTHFWCEADSIFLYLSFDAEVKTDVMVKKAFSGNMVVAVPRISGKSMVFHRIKSLKKGISVNRFGIREPNPSFPVIELGNLKKYLVITPGLAFDSEKNRLGRGGGFYDRFMSKVKQQQECHTMIIGICFKEQLLEKVPVFSHDMKVDLIITDKGIIR